EGPLVIIIDDDPDIREALSKLLETVNLRAVTYPSAAEFLARKRSPGPCCIVLDVRLPGVGGLEFQRRLAQENIPTPIVFITGYGDVPTSVRAMKAGAVEFLTKPIRNQEFLEAVQAALRRDGLRLEREREVGEVRSRHQCLTAREEENHANRQHQRNDDVDGPDSRKASPCRLARCMLRCMSPEMALLRSG